MNKAEKKRWREELDELDLAGLETANELVCELIDTRLGDAETELEERLTNIRGKRAELRAGVEPNADEDATVDEEPAEPTPVMDTLSTPEAIRAILSDEGGPLSPAEIAGRLADVNYDTTGADLARLKSRVSVGLANLKKKGVVENQGRAVGWALTEE